MLQKLKKSILDWNAVDASLSRKEKKCVGILSAIALPMVMASPMVLADGGGIDGFFTAIKDVLHQIFNGVDGIIVMAAVTVIGICFLIRIFGKQQRTVDEATTWIKRAVITLIAWKFLGLFINTINGAASGNEFKWG